MRYFNLKKIILPVFVASFFIACGGGGSSSSTGGTDGIAVDPYISDATFFWDKNKDGIHDSTEPISTASDSSGKFSFSEVIPSGERIVMKDKGTHNGVPYTGTLSANLGENGVVSPLTTLEVTYENADVVSMLNSAGITISSADIHKDPMDASNKSVNFTAATIAIDTFLKLDSFEEIAKDANTLSDIIDAVKIILNSDVSDSSIEDLVKVVDRLIEKVQKDGNLDELAKLKGQADYALNLKNTLGAMTSMEASVIDELSADGTTYIYDSRLLDDRIFSFGATPVKDSGATLSLNLDDITGTTIVWSVLSEPDTSTLALTPAGDLKSVTFTPAVVGVYTIKALATATLNGAVSSKTISFNVTEVLAMDVADVQSMGTSANDEDKLGVVSNQSWVSSKSLNEAQLTAIVGNYAGFTVLGYNSSNGLLVEYTVSSTIKESLENIKLESGVDKVYNRVYAGDNAYGSYALYPSDNGSLTNGGSNWHLETINMPEAWEYSTGSDKFLLGVCDGGFDTKHNDLSGRFASILTSAQSSHGMAVTGAMAANTDNGIGISGINWKVQAVASYMGGSYVEDVITTTKDGKEVKLINNSWGYHIPTSFDPTNNTIAQDRFLGLQSAYAQIRQMITYYDNKLFFWAAGNGIGNGLGNSKGVYGVDAKYDNGVLHYKNSSLLKLDNLLVVGAFVQDKVLVFYSEYGQSVDIAAPTHFDSLALNNGIYPTFGGTSAATPVATAVASLIYSVNPNLTAKEVKEILIDSATEYITQRQTNPYGGIEYLAHPIPILNAQEALKMAKATLVQKVTVAKELTDIFTPTLNLTYTPSSIKYTVTNISIDVKSSDSQANYTSFHSESASSNEINTILDQDKRYHQIDATLTLKYVATGDTFTQTNTTYYSYSDISIKTVNNISLEEVASVGITVSKIDSDMTHVSSTTDVNGLLKIYVDAGTYRLKSSVASYTDSTKDISINEDLSIETDLALTPDTIVKQGSISGYVYDEDGIAIIDALVRISGEDYTNGYFASANTDRNGYYKITGINKVSAIGDAIPDFIMSVSKSGYVQVLRDEVIVLDAQERTENFNLIEETVIQESEYIYINDFEDDVSDWNATGMWHQQDFSIEDLVNINIAKGNVSLSPDDDSNGSLPEAFSGIKAFWYSDEINGNFIGTETGNVAGGQSTAKNEGTLISPEIDLGDQNATLRFSTWWEIESVNPNDTGFDRMYVYVIKADGTEELIKKLNPSVDPKTESRYSKPFTSAGNFRKPVWNSEEFDLSLYVGETIKLKFYFDSVDANFNGFRGWIIDDLKIIETSKLNK